MSYSISLDLAHVVDDPIEATESRLSRELGSLLKRGECDIDDLLLALPPTRTSKRPKGGL